MRDCIKDQKGWINRNQLKLNYDKTEFLLMGAKQQLEKVNFSSITVGDTLIEAKPEERHLVHTFVTSRIDYCNSLLYGMPAVLNKVQRVLNAAARLVYRAPCHCRVTPLLRELHWLPVRPWIHYKILLFTFKTMHGKSPVYLQEFILLKKPGAYRLRSSSNGLLLNKDHFT